MTPDHVREGLGTLAELAGRVAAEQAETIVAIAARYETALRGGGTLFFAGNGGSAADAQHVATEYVVRYESKRPSLRAVALTTDTSLLTAAANDMGFDEVFARQVEALARPGDLLVLHSTSGESPNVVRAAQAARARAACAARTTLGLSPLVECSTRRSPGRVRASTWRANTSSNPMSLAAAVSSDVSVVRATARSEGRLVS